MAGRVSGEVIIAVRVAPDYTGGLAAYARTLAEAIEKQPKEYCILLCLEPIRELMAPLEEGDREVFKMVTNEKIWRTFWTPLFHHLGSRPFLFPILKLLAAVAIPCKRIVRHGQEVKTIHFIGTGWDFCGFAFASAARRMGARFTIWPAVHAKSWGDDNIDIELYNMADVVFCASEYEANHLIARGLKADKIVRCGLPPMCRNDGDGTRLRARLGIGDRRSVLFLGRRDEGKGYPALLKAWSLVIRLFPDAVLLLAGPGNPDASALEQIPSDSFRDLGIPDEQTKADAIAACDLLCLPSVHESFGIVYIEAWSYGKPVICGTAPASRELIEDGITGLWANQNPKYLAEKLIFLLADASLRQRLGKQGNRLQRNRYNIDEMLNIHLQAFGLDELLSGSVG